MTLGSVVRGVLGVTFPPVAETYKYLPQDRGSYDWAVKSSSNKSKSKAEKKQIALSALTLLAFLFFLNILQNCLREHSEQQQSSMLMMAISQAPGTQGRDPAEIELLEAKERSKRDIEEPLVGRRLLQATRQQKFIANYKEVDRNWVNGLTKLSDDEIRQQRQKTEGFTKRTDIEKRQKVQSFTKKTDIEMKTNKINKLIKSPVLADIKGKRRQPEKKEVKSVEFEPKRPSFNKVVDFNDFHEPEKRQEWGVGTPYVFQEQNGFLNTPRNRRSEAEVTTSAPDQEASSSQEESQLTSAGSLEGTTEKVYPVYRHPEETYSNHRYTKEPVSPLHSAYSVPTTRYKYRTKYPGYYQPMNRFAYQYQYSPYRKSGQPEYPMSAVGQYQGPYEDEEVGFNVLKFVWTMVSAFAKPIARIVPSFAKVGSTEAKCYDLLVCEAHRAGLVMGPTAEVLATTLSTFVSWMSPEVDRSSVVDAVHAGKENSCQRQINECDARSGGKSTMTMIAQLMELKL